MRIDAFGVRMQNKLLTDIVYEHKNTFSEILRMHSNQRKYSKKELYFFLYFWEFITTVKTVYGSVFSTGYTECHYWHRARPDSLHFILTRLFYSLSFPFSFCLLTSSHLSFLKVAQFFRVNILGPLLAVPVIRSALISD